ncbi:MAG: RNA polymerase sigma factor [Acidimicrobiales bacterium]
MSVGLPPFQQLVDAHWRDVARLAAALGGAQDGDDVAQQAWTQALAAYPSLAHGRNLRAWLFTITARTAIDSHRGRARRAVPLAELPEQAARATADPADEILWHRVRCLPERQRIAVMLRYVLDLPHAEVARIIGTTPAATRRLVSDALAALREVPGADASEVVP